MPPWLAATLKWVATLLAMALVVGWATPRAIEALTNSVSVDLGFIAGDDEEDDLDITDLEVDDPIETGERRAAIDVSIRDSIVRDVEASELLLGTGAGDEVLIGFPDLEVEPICLTAVRLTVTVIEAPEAIDILARPASVPGLAQLELEQTVPEERIEADGAAIEGVLSGGSSTLDLITLHNTLERLGREVNDGLLVVSLRPTQPLEPDEEGNVPEIRLVSAAAGGADAPLLEWEADASCLDGPSGLGDPDVDGPDDSLDEGDPPIDGGDADGESEDGFEGEDTESDGIDA